MLRSILTHVDPAWEPRLHRSSSILTLVNASLVPVDRERHGHEPAYPWTASRHARSHRARLSSNVYMPAAVVTCSGRSADIRPSALAAFGHRFVARRSKCSGWIARSADRGGSTFINPLMSRWSKHYTAMFPTVSVNYQAIGSGGGIQQFLARTVNFAATDAPLTDDQFQRAGGPAHAVRDSAAARPESVLHVRKAAPRIGRHDRLAAHLPPGPRS